MVKNKFYDHPQLRKENPNRVLDKVRAQWRFRKSSPETPPLPSEMETLEQRVERTIQAEDETTSVIIPPTVSGSSSMWKVFSANELERMEELFVEMIQKSSPVSKVRIKETLEKIDWSVESFVGHGYQSDKVWKASTKGFQVMNV